MIGGQLREVSKHFHPEVRDAVWRSQPARGSDSPMADEAWRYLHTGGYSPDTVRAALAFGLPARDPVRALAESKRFAGPANYCPVLVGALLGARFGASAFGDDQLAHHPKRHVEEIRATGNALAALWTPEHVARPEEGHA
jgi:ADP-ribosylglycohydrolase